MRDFRALLTSLVALFCLYASPSQAAAPWADIQPHPMFVVHGVASPQLWYLDQLTSAFRKIIPFDPNRDPLVRLLEALGDERGGQVNVDQVLKDHHAGTLLAFLQELDGKLNHMRVILNDAQRRQSAGEAPMAEVQSYGDEYSRQRLTVEELAVIIHFYQTMNAKENVLIKYRGVRRMEAQTARLALAVTKFPHTELRLHDENQPVIPFEGSSRDQWRSVVRVFNALGKRYEFNQLWSQMVNVNSGNRRFRHIQSFEERFILEARRWALVEDKPYQARDLLVAYLSSHATTQALDSVPVRLVSWDADVRARLGGTLSEFLARVSAMVNRMQIQRLFKNAALPPSFASYRHSVMVSRFTTVIQTAQSHSHTEACIGALDTAGKYKKTSDDSE